MEEKLRQQLGVEQVEAFPMMYVIGQHVEFCANELADEQPILAQ
jgi:hypothetical protein